MLHLSYRNNSMVAVAPTPNQGAGEKSEAQECTGDLWHLPLAPTRPARVGEVPHDGVRHGPPLRIRPLGGPVTRGLGSGPAGRMNQSSTIQGWVWCDARAHSGSDGVPIGPAGWTGNGKHKVSRTTSAASRHTSLEAKEDLSSRMSPAQVDRFMDEAVRRSEVLPDRSVQQRLRTQ